MLNMRKPSKPNRLDADVFARQGHVAATYRRRNGRTFLRARDGFIATSD